MSNKEIALCVAALVIIYLYWKSNNLSVNLNASSGSDYTASTGNGYV